MDWQDINYFTKKEFNGQSHLVDENFIYDLNTSRGILKEPIHISTVKGAIARFGGSKTSQHYVGSSEAHIVRKSTAIDVFIEGIPFLNLMALVKMELFSGIGIYVDTNGPDGRPWIMFHLDQRKNYKKDNPLVWVATKKFDVETANLKTFYHYPQNDASLWLYLKKELFFRERFLG